MNRDIAKQVQAGHTVMLPLSTVSDLPNPFLSSAEVIPQMGRRLRIIFNFTWSGLNKTTAWDAPTDAMRFRSSLFCIIWRELTADPTLGLVYLSKVDLVDA